jgi:hypothetical protein
VDGLTARALAQQVTEAAAEGSDTSALQWHVLSVIPLVGCPFDSARQFIAAGDEVAQRALLPTFDVAHLLSPQNLHPPGRGRLRAQVKDAPTPWSSWLPLVVSRSAVVPAVIAGRRRNHTA